MSTNKQSARESDCRGKQRHAAASPQAAAQNQVPVIFANVPADGRQELDRSIRSLVAVGFTPGRICRTLRLQRLYGISARALGRYIRQRRAAGSLPAVGSVHRAASPRAGTMPLTQRLVDTASAPADASRNTNVDLCASPAAVDARPAGKALDLQDTSLDHLQAETFARLRSQLLDADLTPEQLCKIASAIAQQRSALSRAQAQSNANHKAARDRRILRIKDKDDARKRKESKKSLQERIWEIYGITRPWGWKKQAEELKANPDGLPVDPPTQNTS